MANYLVLVNISLIVFFVVYWVTLRKLTFFQWNRIYLLTSLGLSLLMPLTLFVDWDLEERYRLEITLPIQLSNLEEMPAAHVPAPVTDVPSDTPWSWTDYILPFYWSTVAIAFLWFMFRLWLIRSAFRFARAHYSFSFFNRMFVGKNVSHRSTIEAHELIHIKQGHSYDIVLIEIIQLFNWFNPLLMWYKKELKFQHELIADDHCQVDRVQYAKILLAEVMHVPSYEIRHEFSNHSFLKKRITMLFKEKSPNQKKYCYLLLVPTFLLMGVLAITVSCSGSDTKEAKESGVEHVADTHAIAEENEPVVEDSVLSEPQIRLPEPKAVPKGRVEVKEEMVRFPEPKEKDTDELVHFPAVPPEYPGGSNAYDKWLVKETEEFAEQIDAIKTQKQVVVSFVVEKDGSLSSFSGQDETGLALGKHIYQAMASDKKWSPAVDKGKPVRTKYAILLTVGGKESGVENRISIGHGTGRFGPQEKG